MNIETKEVLTPEKMKKGGHYNWRYQSDRLIYLGENWSGNGYWHQFKKIGDPRPVWCEIKGTEIPLMEETEDDVAGGL